MSDEVAVIGSFVIIALLLAVVALATGTYRKSVAQAAAAITAKPGDPIELTCGIRLGGWNASWPAGGFRLTDDGVAFSCLGFGARAPWADVKTAELIKPLNQIGWGVRFRIPTRQPDSVIVWLGSRSLAERVMEACEVHQVPIKPKPRVAL